MQCELKHRPTFRFWRAHLQGLDVCLPFKLLTHQAPNLQVPSGCQQTLRASRMTRDTQDGTEVSARVAPLLPITDCSSARLHRNNQTETNHRAASDVAAAANAV